MGSRGSFTVPKGNLFAPAGARVAGRGYGHMKPPSKRGPIKVRISRSGDRSQSIRRRNKLLAISVLMGPALVFAGWRSLPRDYSEQACRRNLGTLYVAACRAATGENPEPPPPVPNRAAETPAISPAPDLSKVTPPALEDVFTRLASGFWMTPDDNRYLAHITGGPQGEVGWLYHEPSAAELLCPKDPSYDEKSGYFSLARSWTGLHDIPPGSYEWCPEPGVLAKCIRHHLILRRDGSVVGY
jgi:hypothetical protein